MIYMLRFLKIVCCGLFICIPKANAQFFGGQLKNSLVSRYPIGSVFCKSGPTAIVDVTNPTTGKIWMDRNLGATQSASSKTDANAYGDLYQWGRRADGHQCRTSPNTTNLSSIDQPTHSSFIIAPNSPNTWRNPWNTNLWQGVNGVNNPCPKGYRLPTKTEINNEILSWTINNQTEAFNSPLKWIPAGSRGFDNGLVGSEGSAGAYWTGTPGNNNAEFMYLASSASTPQAGQRQAFGFSVRCIKETVGIVGAIDCASSTITGNLSNGQVASNVSVSVPYTGGNSGFYISQSIASTNVLGLTADLSSGLLASGSGNLTLVISGTPNSSGTASFALNVGGQSCSFDIDLQPQYPANSVFCNGTPTYVKDVISPTGKIWMDRNLGATQAATSSTDAASYGDLYQWGRLADGHQCRTSATTATLSSSDQPAHGNFILAPSNPYDWRSPQNTNLWQGVNGVNNPCPSGYRIPTQPELEAERLSWSPNTSVGAFASPLKLPVAGNSRDGSSGSLGSVGTVGSYWGSSVSGTLPLRFYFNSSRADMRTDYRAYGHSVRCIKETVGVIGSLNCANSTITGNLTNGQVASNVSVSVPYTGGNSGFYISQSIASTNVLGLTADLSSGLLASGSGNLTLVISGTPNSSGTASFALNVGGQSCSFSMVVQAPTSGYGADITDVESNTYKTVYIGTQQWMAENLKVTKYNDGTVIPNVVFTQWPGLYSGSWAYYGNNATNNAIYGKLYNWYAVSQTTNGNKNICPIGWHIPTDAEWTVLTDYLGGETVAGGKMKNGSWNSPNTNATNTSLFTGLPGGYRYENGNDFTIGNNGYWWSSSENYMSSAWNRTLSFDKGNTQRVLYRKESGFSIRCLKD